MLGFFRYGLLQFVLIVLIYYSATLIFREREHGLSEIVGASPYPDWVIVASKTVTLCAAIALLLCVSMGASIAMQLSAGQDDLQPGVYLQGLFLYNGFYFWHAVRARRRCTGAQPGEVERHGAAPVRVRRSPELRGAGLEHVLYGFRIPFVVYSDMNGFGHFRLQTIFVDPCTGACSVPS